MNDPITVKGNPVPTIHPSAIIDKEAELDEDVQIGRACVVTGRVRLGRGTRLLGSVHLQGPASIGADNTIYPFACVGFAPQDLKFDASSDGAGVAIGDGNILREGVTIHRATGEQPTTLGDRNFLMANSHIGHDVVMGHDGTLANGALLGGHVAVGDGAIVGGNAGVHQFCRVGRLSMISGVACVVQDVPPFCVVYTSRRVGSLNIIGLRRAGLRDHIGPLTQAFNLLYKQSLSNGTAMERIESDLADDPLCVELARFVKKTRRGISPYANSSLVGAEA